MEFVSKNLSSVLLGFIILTLSVFLIAKLLPVILVVAAVVFLYTSAKKMISNWTRRKSVRTSDSSIDFDVDIVKSGNSKKYSTNEAIDVEYTEVKH